jgi:hypothetical protein
MPCIKCGKETQGYKCDVCGAEAEQHVGTHGLNEDGSPMADHPRGADHCMPKCVGCDQAEANCTC